jgi:DNA-binding NarL/FixJ family response regulator
MTTDSPDADSAAAAAAAALDVPPVTRGPAPAGRRFHRRVAPPPQPAVSRAVDLIPSMTHETQPATVILVDDHEVVRAGLRSMLEKLGGLTITGEAADGRSAVRLARDPGADLIVLDVVQPLLTGIEATRQIVAADRDARVLICAAEHKQVFVEEALRAGARGYLLKNSPSQELEVAVRAVLRGEIYLSPKAAEIIVDKYVRNAPPGGEPTFSCLSAREREVLQQLAEGKSNKQISAALNISVRTVEAHRMQLMEKLNIRSVAELTKYAIREGLTTLDL